MLWLTPDTVDQRGSDHRINQPTRTIGTSNKRDFDFNDCSERFRKKRRIGPLVEVSFEHVEYEPNNDE